MSISPPECYALECDRPAPGSTGLCSAHYQRLKRGRPLDGTIMDRRLPEWPECSFVGCNQIAESKIASVPLCPSHANQKRRGQTVRELRKIGVYKICQVPGCERKHFARGLCNNHSVRMNTYSLTPERLIEIVTAPCSICGSSEAISVDHDHSCCPGETSCGKCVRGGLCSGCNLGLGAFRDDPARLLSAISYLSKTSARIVIDEYHSS